MEGRRRALLSVPFGYASLHCEQGTPIPLANDLQLFNFRWQSLFKFGWQWTHNQLINIIMLKKTISYETPDMMVFEMHPESGMLTVTSPVYGEEGEAGADGFLTIIGEDY